MELAAIKPHREPTKLAKVPKRHVAPGGPRYMNVARLLPMEFNREQYKRAVQ